MLTRIATAATTVTSRERDQQKHVGTGREDDPEESRHFLRRVDRHCDWSVVEVVLK
jgi:hypothetical protein